MTLGANKTRAEAAIDVIPALFQCTKSLIDETTNKRNTAWHTFCS